ncbi:Tetrathionate reductase subunit B [Neomoorella glycerini]|uniref:Tetrathionate reductase subunit B n=1 Tax=Neomoorella glycerini TaxID=55779 RepID=A0A6I5ZWP8_9FIRM|nr:4Fe-4S dicluster domain-containing protein [Moorella glycerini]QGP94018.1 Tetrathionate reductase subunit B [Moorella glycerini]
MSVKYGMVIDLRKCIGCDACMVACKMENGVVRGEWRTRVWERDYGDYPMVTKIKIPTLCNHCQAAPCQQVCPVQATYHAEGDVVLVDPDKCIGCGYCIAACPYGARFKDARTGIVDKCTYCYHRLAAGLVPVCVSTCVSHARIFGDLNDPESYINQYIREHKALQVAGTSTFYVLAEGLDRSLLPKDLEKEGLINLWKNIVHPAGKALMGAAAAAVVVGTAINAFKGGKRDEE